MYVTGRVINQRWDNTGDVVAEVITDLGTFPVKLRQKSQSFAQHVRAVGWDGLRWKRDVDVMVRISAEIALRRR